MAQHRQARRDAKHTETKLFSMFLFEKIRVNPSDPCSVKKTNVDVLIIVDVLVKH